MNNLLQKNYWRIRAGNHKTDPEQAYKEGFISIGFRAKADLTKNVPKTWQEFREIHKNNFAKTDGWFHFYTVHRFLNDIKINDIVITPLNKEECIIGEVSSEAYFENTNNIISHCRKIIWQEQKIKKENISNLLASSVYMRGTLHSLTKYAEEINDLMNHKESYAEESPGQFALEQHLENFMITNWEKIDISNDYEIYSDGNEIGQQLRTDTGPLDILAISKDKKELLVIELKAGKVSDNVIGQVQRYMAYVKESIANPNQTVRGAIIASGKDKKLERALQMTQNVDFYKYDIRFNLTPVEIERLK